MGDRISQVLIQLEQEELQLESELRRIRDAIAALKGDTSSKAQLSFPIPIPGPKRLERRTPSEVIRDLFTTNPERRYVPGEIRDLLQEYRKKGLLDSKADNLLHITHSVLRTLVESKTIVRHQTQDTTIVRYSLNKK